MVSWMAFFALLPRPFMLKEAVRLLVKSLRIHAQNYRVRSKPTFYKYSFMLALFLMNHLFPHF